LEGYVALVTGGGRGLGRAMTLGLARAGARVVATAAREAAELEAGAREAEDGHVVPIVADVTRAQDCERVVAMALERFGRLDILVNNAGRGMKYVSERFFTEPARFWEADPDAWRMMIDTNVNGPFLMARSAVRPMLQAGRGRIVNISMNHETMRRRGFIPYGPSRAGAESLSIIMTEDLRPYGITVNMLLPGGATDTGMIPDAMSEDARRSLLPSQVMGAPAVFLASPEADGVTGERIVAKDFDAWLTNFRSRRLV
jgi:3-oxoacyl-[acyl-carrier protein] reductase